MTASCHTGLFRPCITVSPSEERVASYCGRQLILTGRSKPFRNVWKYLSFFENPPAEPKAVLQCMQGRPDNLRMSGESDTYLEITCGRRSVFSGTTI